MNNMSWGFILKMNSKFRKKYIVYENMMGMELPVVFSELDEHFRFGVPGTVISAGFCALTWKEDTGPQWLCWGKSATLGVESRNETDEAILNEFVT
jgi:hypothetical protein